MRWFWLGLSGVAALACGPKVEVPGETGTSSTSTGAPGSDGAPISVSDGGSAPTTGGVTSSAETGVIDDLGSSSACNDGIPVNGEVCFGDAIPVATSVTATRLATGDVDGDGIADLAFVGTPQPMQYGGAVALGNLQEKLKVTAPWTRPGLVGALGLGDFDADGHADVAVARYDGPIVEVGRGKASGDFSFQDSMMLPDIPVSLHVADFIGDGSPDALAEGASGSLTWLQGAGGAPGLILGATADYGMGECGQYDPAGVAIGDFGGNGTKGAVAVLALPCDFVPTSLLRRFDDLSAPPMSNGDVVAEWIPAAVSSGDLDADGIDELVVVHDGRVERWGLSAGELKIIDAIDEPLSLVSLAVADFDFDFVDDVAVGTAGGPILLITAWNGDRRTNMLAYDEYPGELAAADLDGDAFSDIAVVDPTQANGQAMGSTPVVFFSQP